MITEGKMEPDKIISLEFDKERMKKEQNFQLILSFSIFAFVFILGIMLMKLVHPVFTLVCFYGVVYFIWWPLVLGFYLWAGRHPIEKMVIDPEERTVTINKDVYRLYEDRVYITVDSGVAKFLHYAVINLTVTNEDGKRVGSYFMGPVSGPYSKKSRGKINDVLPLISAAFQIKGTIDTIKKEKEDITGTVKIEFPAESIKKTFYATGILILGIGDLGFLISFLPPEFYGYGDDKMLPGALSLLRLSSAFIIIVGLTMCARFFYRYRRLARTVEISWNKIKINGKEFFYEDIRRIGLRGAVEDPDNRGEEQSWLYIDCKGQIHKYYLGQVKNKKCFEPRRRLKAALAEYFKR